PISPRCPDRIIKGLGEKMKIAAVRGLAALAALACSAGRAQMPPAGPALSEADTAQAIKDFNGTCASCHGDNGGGGDRAPALNDNPHLRTLDAAGIAAIITNGQRGMPAFGHLPHAEIARLAAWIHTMNISGLASAPPEQVA